MDKNIAIQRIQNIGLSHLEAKIYLATLENGTAPASAIATKAKMNRVSTYDILEKLLKRGLITSSVIRGMKHFTAMDPKIFVDDTEQRTKELKKTLPFLQSLLKSSENHPTVRYFEGMEAIKKSYKETLESSTEILNYANSQNIRTHWPEYDEEYVAKRKENRVFLRGLAPDDEYGRTVQSGDILYFRETRLLKKEHFQVENEINIFDNKVLIASYEPSPFAIIIESQAVAETQRQIFEVLWSLIRG